MSQFVPATSMIKPPLLVALLGEKKGKEKGGVDNPSLVTAYFLRDGILSAGSKGHKPGPGRRGRISALRYDGISASAMAPRKEGKEEDYLPSSSLIPV